VLAASDPRYVKFELDTARAAGGGADPAKLIERYRDRLSFLHLKDVVDMAGGSIFRRFLQRSNGSGSKVGRSRTAKQSAAISKAFLEAHGIRV
jgi:inosose dehydratase